MKKRRMKFLIITGLFMLCVSGCSNPDNSSSSTDAVVTSLITFDKQGGTGGSNTVVATLNQSMPEATAPTKEGYTFLGYSDGKSGGNLYYDSVMGSHKNWDKTKDTTLYAQWEDSNYYTQGLVFEYYEDNLGVGYYSVTGYNGTSPVVIIPSTYEGLAVDWIDDEVFKDKKHITSIYVPTSVIGYGESVFAGCDNLKEITMPFVHWNSQHSKTFGHFFGSENEYGRDSADIVPATLKTVIINYAPNFGNYYNAFYDCVNITSITLPNDVLSIPNYAFASCSSLINFSIPSSVTSIDGYAFAWCSSLTTITIPSSVISIENGAFARCSSLTSIIISSSVTSIGDMAFAWCSSLTSINVEEENQYYKSVNGVLFDKDGTTLIAYPNGRAGSYVIPSGVTSIGNSAFNGCDRLISITTPSSVTNIGDGAFNGCGRLTSITISSSVTGIGDGAFMGCTSLNSITIPSNVISIGASMFYGWTSSQTIYIQGRETAPDTWHSYWDYNCSANIVWNA